MISDMERRVWNYASRESFHVKFENPGDCFPAANLYLYCVEGKMFATIGDLTTTMSGNNLLRIIEIVQRRQAGEIFQTVNSPV